MRLSHGTKPEKSQTTITKTKASQKIPYEYNAPSEKTRPFQKRLFSTVFLVLVLRRISRPIAGFEMRSFENLEDLDEAVLAGGVSGVDVAEDQFQPAFVDEALDEAVEVILVESAVATIGFAHDVDDEAARFRQFYHFPEGGRRQMGLGEAASAGQSVKLRHWKKVKGGNLVTVNWNGVVKYRKNFNNTTDLTAKISGPWK